MHTEEEVEAVRPEEVEVEHIEEVKEAEIAVEVEVRPDTLARTHPRALTCAH